MWHEIFLTCFTKTRFFFFLFFGELLDHALQDAHYVNLVFCPKKMLQTFVLCFWYKHTPFSFWFSNLFAFLNIFMHCFYSGKCFSFFATWKELSVYSRRKQTVMSSHDQPAFKSCLLEISIFMATSCKRFSQEYRHLSYHLF